MLGLREITFARGIDGEIARQFRIGWAPDEWDALASQAGVEEKVLDDVGLAFSESTQPHARCAARTRCVSDHERRWRPGCGRGTNFAGFNRPCEIQELTRDTDLYEVPGVVWPQLGER